MYSSPLAMIVVITKTPYTYIYNTFHVLPPICHKLDCATLIKYFEKIPSTFGGHHISKYILPKKEEGFYSTSKCPLPFPSHWELTEFIIKCLIPN
jgi:hypothetical protein